MTRKLTGKITLRTRPLRAPARRAPPPPRTTPSAYAEGPVARFIAVKPVGSFLPGLTRKAFEKYGFAAATLITDWREIAGHELASYTTPERLKWPRGPAGETADTGEGRPGGTLVLRVDPARALDVEYKARQIVERINAYFGYRAVESLRLIQAPVADKSAPATAASRPAAARSAHPDAPPGDPLQAALSRLAASIAAAPKKPR